MVIASSRSASIVTALGGQIMELRGWFGACGSGGKALRHSKWLENFEVSVLRCRSGDGVGLNTWS